MRNHYNFNEQINYLRAISQTSISLAEIINTYFKRMSKPLIKKAIKELKFEYDYQYFKVDDEKLGIIKTVLNLVLKQQVTNVDELFMGLAFELNAYYGVKYLNLEKKMPYYQKCTYCERYVSNYHFGRKIHESKCSSNQGATKNIHLQKKKKYTDTQEKYQNRQSKVPPEMQIEQDSPLPEDKKISKKAQLKEKKMKKNEQISILKKRKVEQDQVYDGAMNFNHLTDEMFYFEDDDESLMKKGEEKTQGKYEQSNEIAEIDAKIPFLNEKQIMRNQYFNDF